MIADQLEEAFLGEAKAVDDYPWKFAKRGPKRSLNKLRVGRLGKVSYEIAKRHEDAGTAKHQWAWYDNWGPGKSREKCRVCGTMRYVSDKTGRPIRI
jgi:hypothetical protein